MNQHSLRPKKVFFGGGRERRESAALTRPLMISSMVYSAYSSLTLPPATPPSSGVGAGGGGKQFGITRCLGRPPLRPFALVPLDGSAGMLASAPVSKDEQGRDNPMSSFGVVAPDVARDDAGVNISRRKKNLAWLTASRCCARRMFSSTCVCR